MLNESDILVFRSLACTEKGIDYVEIESEVHLKRIHGSFRLRNHRVLMGKVDTDPLLYVETWMREEDIGKIKNFQARVWSYHKKDEAGRKHREALQLALHRVIGGQIQYLQKALNEVSEWKGL